jgi:hypothetical protein
VLYGLIVARNAFVHNDGVVPVADVAKLDAIEVLLLNTSLFEDSGSRRIIVSEELCEVATRSVVDACQSIYGDLLARFEGHFKKDRISRFVV